MSFLTLEHWIFGGNCPNSTADWIAVINEAQKLHAGVVARRPVNDRSKLVDLKEALSLVGFPSHMTVFEIFDALLEPYAVIFFFLYIYFLSMCNTFRGHRICG